MSYKASHLYVCICFLNHMITILSFSFLNSQVTLRIRVPMSQLHSLFSMLKHSGGQSKSRENYDWKSKLIKHNWSIEEDEAHRIAVRHLTLHLSHLYISQDVQTHFPRHSILTFYVKMGRISGAENVSPMIKFKVLFSHI